MFFLNVIEGDLGGNMGLLVGASSITVAELLDLIIYNAVLKLLKRKKERRAGQTSTTGNHTDDHNNPNSHVQNNNLVFANGTRDIGAGFETMEPSFTSVMGIYDKSHQPNEEEGNVISTYM